MDLYEKNGNILYILNVLKKYSDFDHKLSAVEIQRKVAEIYNVEIDPRTIRRNINLLKYKLNGLQYYNYLEFYEKYENKLPISHLSPK